MRRTGIIADNTVYHCYLKAIGLTFAVMSVVYLFYFEQFIFGNHDWPFMRYGMSLGIGVWEARITQFLPPWLFLKGQILPILGALLAFLYMSVAAVLLAYWFDLPHRIMPIMLFTLLIVLNPYHLAGFYYNLQTISLGCWHLLTVSGVFLIWRFLYQRKILLLLGGVVCLLVALCGYSPIVEMILTLMLVKFLLDVVTLPVLDKQFVIKWIKFITIIFLVGCIYLGIIDSLKQLKIISEGMYNTQLRSIDDIFVYWLKNWAQPFYVLASGIPYMKVKLGGCLFLLFICTIIASFIYNRQRFWFVLALLFIIIYSMFFVAYIAEYNVFYVYRVHVFSVAYFSAFLFALVCALSKGKGFFGYNIVCLLSVMLLLSEIKADIFAQKVWYLGNKQDAYAVERIKERVLSDVAAHKHYRFFPIGELYGRAKFAHYDADYHSFYPSYYSWEYDTAPYFINNFSSSAFFLYEPENPIWGDSFYAENILHVVTNENIALKDKIAAELFAQNFGNDRTELAYQFDKLKAFPASPFYIVGKKDIILILSKDEKNQLMLRNLLRRGLNE